MADHELGINRFRFEMQQHSGDTLYPALPLIGIIRQHRIFTGQSEIVESSMDSLASDSCLISSSLSPQFQESYALYDILHRYTVQLAHTLSQCSTTRTMIFMPIV